VSLDRELLWLIRRLIARAETSPLRHDNGIERVMLDVEVSGVRCLLMARRRRTPAAFAARAGLSPREREVAHLVAQGSANKRIAAVLGISSDTVATHIRRIFAKLDVHTRAAMTARVVEGGLASSTGRYVYGASSIEM
jgi:DNA-binding CsgD family transcriptional regulator